MNTPLTRRNASTPIASIPSSLSTRSTPSVPPASTLYEPLLKSILARRFAYNVLSISAAAAWLLATRSPSLSPYQTLVLRASQHQYRKALLIVFVSSTSLTLCHSLMSGITGTGGRDDPKLGIWTGSKKHPFHLNGRLIYIFLAQASGAMLYWLRDVLRDRFDIQWMGHSNISKRTLSSLTSSVISMILLSAISTLLSLFIFGALRMLIFPLLYRIPILHDLLRPLMAHFFRPKYTISFLWSHFDLVVRAYLIVLSTHLIWDITSTMFDVAFSMPATATEGSKDSALILVSGVSCADSYFQLHAFYELCSLSSVSKGAMTKPPLSRRGIADWWVRDRKDKAAQKALPNRDLDHMIVEVLGIFISHSLREDALGHVQRDIPRVLEAMVLYLTAIEEYQSELSTSLSAAEASTGGNLTATELSRLVAFRKETVLAGEWIDALSTGVLNKSPSPWV
ncbi:hypothetical protein EW145_g3066 [Phellinidium pouzarii]|uniref:Nucleoporin protein Ndc1-Nup n=1 Tax=Phellinidium pouzarii TaxID=167371 RepID=A0A4S4L8Q8_9AGAM|nr:hypothetical protein EW145_g3066 [Phellinidium pouzarii]